MQKRNKYNKIVLQIASIVIAIIFVITVFTIGYVYNMYPEYSNSESIVNISFIISNTLEEAGVSEEINSIRVNFKSGDVLLIENDIEHGFLCVTRDLKLILLNRLYVATGLLEILMLFILICINVKNKKAE